MLTPFFVWDERKLKRIHPEKVAFIESDKNYTIIYIPNPQKIKAEAKTVEDLGFDKYMVRSTLASAYKKLPKNLFIRTHRSYIVSVLYIDNISRTNLEVGAASIPIARQHYKAVKRKLIVIGGNQKS